MRGSLRILAAAASATAFQPAPTARAATVARPAFVAFAPRAAPRAMFDMFKSKEPEPPEEPEKAKPKISLDGLMQANSRSSDGLPARGPVHHTAVRHMWPRTSHVAHGLRHTTAVRAPRRHASGELNWQSCRSNLAAAVAATWRLPIGDGHGRGRAHAG